MEKKAGDSLIKKAEQNSLNEARFWTDFVQFIDALQHNIIERDDSRGSPLYERGGMKKLKEGLALLRSGAYEEMHFAISRCFVFAGVGGEEAKQYSKELAQKLLKNVPLSWLDEHFRIPSSWDPEAMEQITNEVNERMRNC